MRGAGGDGTQSIRRALDVLDMLAASGDGGARLSEISLATALSAPTAHRVLRVLVEREIVEQKPSRRYVIGEQIPMLALARTSRSPLLLAVEPHLRGLADLLGDTAYLTIRTGLDALCVARRFGNFPIQVVTIPVGARRPLGVSAAGVAMLAAMTEEEAREAVTGNQPRFRPYRTTAAQVFKAVDRARARGYVFRERGLVAGTRAVSVVIPPTAKTRIAALTMGGIDRRISASRASDIADMLRHRVREIVESLRL